MTKRQLPYHMIIHGISIAAIIGMAKVLHTASEQRDLYLEALTYEWRRTAPEIPKFVEGRIVFPKRECMPNNPERR